MINILRDESSGICRTGKGDSASTGSQVSVLYPSMLDSHWFTGTRNPKCSVYKPFIFCDNIIPPTQTISPRYGMEDPARMKPRFQKQVDRKHALFISHEKIRPVPGDQVNVEVLEVLKKLEETAINDVELICQRSTFQEDELGSLFKDSVYAEMKFYNQC